MYRYAVKFDVVTKQYTNSSALSVPAQYCIGATLIFSDKRQLCKAGQYTHTSALTVLVQHCISASMLFVGQALVLVAMLVPAYERYYRRRTVLYERYYAISLTRYIRYIRTSNYI